jgi:hypothetical protein
MIPFDEMPEGNAGLARAAVRFPSFRESDGSRCYVTVPVGADGPAHLTYDEDHYGLTPEQLMLGSDHGAF